MYKIEKVCIKMANDNKKSVLQGVKEQKYSLEHAKTFLNQDQVFINALRWAPLHSEQFSNIDVNLFDDVVRVEALLFSRMKSEPGEEENPFRLMNKRFVIHPAEACRGLSPVKFRARGDMKKMPKEMLVFNAPECLGVWLTLRRDLRDPQKAYMHMGLTQLGFSQDSLTDWHLDCLIPNSLVDRAWLLDVMESTERNTTLVGVEKTGMYALWSTPDMPCGSPICPLHQDFPFPIVPHNGPSGLLSPSYQSLSAPTDTSSRMPHDIASTTAGLSNDWELKNN
jgi:hypothetical protein